MNKPHIGFIGVLIAALITAACGSTDTGNGMKAKTDNTEKTDTAKPQAADPGPGTGKEMMDKGMDKGMKMEGKQHTKGTTPK